MCCTLLCYLDNRSAVGVTAHNTSGSLTSLVFPQRDSWWGLSQPWLGRNWGGRKFCFASLKYMNCDMEEKGIVVCDCLPPEPRCPPP